MGPRPMIWAAELHQYHDKYYYFATFTNREVKIDTVKGNEIERRASHILVGDRAEEGGEEGAHRFVEFPAHHRRSAP